MSLQRLLEGECGGSNHLVRVTSHVTQDRAFRQDGIRPPDSTEDAIPESFHMGSLLEKLQDVEPVRPVNPAWKPPIQRPEAAAASSSNLEQYWQSDNWVTSFPGVQPVGAAAAAFPHRLIEHVWDSVPPQDETSSFPLASDFLNTATDTQENFDEASKNAAAALANTVTDSEVQDTQFMDFIRTIAGDNWMKEMDKDLEKKQEQVEDTHNDIWTNLQTEWDKLMKLDEETDWLTEKDRNYDQYDFVEKNPFLDHPSPFEEGCKKLSEGDIPSAVLLFEAATRQEPDHVEAWQYLGTTQAQNEQDVQAIAALKKCLSLQNNNLTALMALAVSCTNESLGRDACVTLKQWLDAHPKYRHLSSEHNADEVFKRQPMIPWVNREIHNKICQLLQSAAALAIDEPDPDVQCALGVLYNLSGEHDKAVECFQEALKVRSDDYLLWNKLGASLANGNRSEEAIKAYYNALHLSPGCIRSRFNLGVSCLNLKAYREAAEHFLTALNIQATARGLDGRTPEKSMSDSIWNSLRMVVTLLDRQDLIPHINKKDLTNLNREFGLD